MPNHPTNAIKPEPPMRTAIYARFSSQLQKDNSIEDQVRICTERAEREGWEVTAVFSDFAISGAVRDRPGLNALVEHIRDGHAQMVMAESLDRISRNLGDMHHLFERLKFAGASIFTLSEGPINALQIGFKGTMAGEQLKDMADKIRRGQSGRVAAGRAAGNIVYGYRKIHRLDARGEAERGLREIDPDQADIIRRIVAEYLAGDSPLTIARRLNAEGVPSPTGKIWLVSMIGGDEKRGNGILCNAIYAGDIVYNRTRMIRDPETRRRVSRLNPREQWQTVHMPDLAIIDRNTWAAIRAMKAEKQSVGWTKAHRPKRLLSGLVKCGHCDGNFTVVSQKEWGCANARRAGTCKNRRTIQNNTLERRVFDGLSRELLSPERISKVAKAYHDERARLQRAEKVQRSAETKQVDVLDRKIERLVEAIATGGDIPQLLDALQAARQQREAITDRQGENAAENIILLFPAIAEEYRKAVDRLGEMLSGNDISDTVARNTVRSLIDRVILTPTDERTGMHIDVEGRLQNILAIATGQPVRSPTVPMVAKEGLDRNSGLRKIRV